ncbi:MAG: peptidoglycan-associated lipoprotein Pal [Gammaproteobacteria bacterium]|nr:peptidoglycan-associated lipoprotein Pal [Gammaproteobacteria bacterium]
MKQVGKVLLLTLIAIAFVGCGGKEVKEEAPAEEVVTTPVKEEVKAEEVVEEKAAPVEEGKDLLSERKIYFDFDKSEIKDEFQAIIEAHAKHLMANPSISISIEGHCDERGTREYNMALGERRAHSVMQMLSLLGVSKRQINTVSFGEERPDVDGHDESAWRWNRRAVFVYNE